MADGQIQKEIVVKINADNSGALEATNETNNALTNLGNNQGIKKATGGATNLRTALKEAQNEAQRLLLANQSNTKEYQNAITRVAEIRDQQELYNRAVISNDAGNRLQGVSKSAGVASASVGALSQTFKSIGVNSAGLESSVGVLQSIIGLIGLIDSVGDIGDYLTPFRNRILGVAGATEAATIATVQQGVANEATAVSTTALATATESSVVATESATVATKGLGLALKSVGIGLIISALAYLITNFDKVKKVIQDIFPALKDTGKLWDDVRMAAFGLGNVIKEFLVAPIVAFVQVLKGDFKEALNTLANSANVVANFHRGVAYEKKQIDIENKREELEREQTQLEQTIKILKASGDKALAEQRRQYQIKKELAELSDKDDKEKAKEIAEANVESIVFETGLIKEKMIR
ncbi:hypothetical protein [Pedobacter steynii]